MRKFYEHQDQAYQATTQLAIALGALFFGTVLLSGIVVTYLLIIWYVLNDGDPLAHKDSLIICFGITGTVCLGIVISGSVIKTLQLQAGGRVIAEDLNGRLVDEAGQDLELQELLNIVEEMAIASGIRTPPVYLLEYDDGINAFAAGYDLQDAVVGVTRGAIRCLNRDQLQGVIAHEFSHIFNGDMRLNLRMIGILHGILSITIAAEMLISAANSVFSAPRPGAKEGGATIVGLSLLLVGIALWPVGLIGAAISLLVKAATSRQREFLADAYAVQFTRNPAGLADALKRIAGHTAGSRVRAPKAIEASHMFFAEGCGRLASWLASHPPLSKRILRLEPEWDGTALYLEENELGPYQGAFAGSLGLVSNLHGESGEKKVAVDYQPSTPSTSCTNSSAVERRTREYSIVSNMKSKEFVATAYEGLPETLIQVTQATGGTSLVLYGLWLLHAADEQAGLEVLQVEDRRRVAAVLPVLCSLDESQHILLLDTAIEELPKTTGGPRGHLKDACQRLIQLNETDNLFHWMWGTIVGPPLGLGSDEDRKTRYGRLEQVAGACEILLSRVCHSGTDQAAVAAFSFQRGVANLGLQNIGLRTAAECSWDNFQLAVEVISELAAAPRRKVLLACSSAITSDREITCEEAYVIRGICQRLGYAVPCVLPGQPVAPGS